MVGYQVDKSKVLSDLRFKVPNSLLQYFFAKDHFSLIKDVNSYCVTALKCSTYLQAFKNFSFYNGMPL